MSNQLQGLLRESQSRGIGMSIWRPLRHGDRHLALEISIKPKLCNSRCTAHHRAGSRTARGEGRKRRAYKVCFPEGVFIAEFPPWGFTYPAEGLHSQNTFCSKAGHTKERRLFFPIHTNSVKNVFSNKCQTLCWAP